MNTKRIIGMYLAAGKSSRMGTNKLSLPLHGTALGNHALQAALRSELSHVIVVTGEEDPGQWLSPTLFDSPVRKKWHCVPAKDAALGMAHSIRCGLREAIDAYRAEAVMIILADQPFVSAQLINVLIHRYQQAVAERREFSFVAPVFQGNPRPPAILAKVLFPALMTLEGDEGARRILRFEQPAQGIAISYGDTDCFRDVDTPAEYDAIKQTSPMPLQQQSWFLSRRDFGSVSTSAIGEITGRADE